MRLPKLCQGLRPSEVEECGVEWQKVVLQAEGGVREKVQRENPLKRHIQQDGGGEEEGGEEGGQEEGEQKGQQQHRHNMDFLAFKE